MFGEALIRLTSSGYVRFIRLNVDCQGFTFFAGKLYL